MKQVGESSIDSPRVNSKILNPSFAVSLPSVCGFLTLAALVLKHSITRYNEACSIRLCRHPCRHRWVKGTAIIGERQVCYIQARWISVLDGERSEGKLCWLT